MKASIFHNFNVERKLFQAKNLNMQKHIQAIFSISYVVETFELLIGKDRIFC